MKALKRVKEKGQEMRMEIKSKIDSVTGAQKEQAALERLHNTLSQCFNVAKSQIMARDWEATVKVVVSLMGMELMVGAKVRRVEIEATTSTPAILPESQTAPAAEGTPSIHEEPVSEEDAPDVAPEVKTAKVVDKVKQSLGGVLTKLESTRHYCQMMGFGGMVGAAFDLRVFGTGVRIEIELEVESLASTN